MRNSTEAVRASPRPAGGMIRNILRLLLVLWAGSLWSLAFVAYILFHAQTDRHLAGIVVGRLLTAETYLGAAVGVLALLLPGRTKFLWGYLAALLMAANEWGLRRLMDTAHARGSAWGLSFGAWHGVSAVLYGAACLAVVVLIWRQEHR
jgi:hypothetical protein